MELDPDNADHADLRALRNANIERANALGARGVGIDTNRQGAVLEFLLDQLVGTGPTRLAFEFEHATEIAQMLTMAEEQVRRAILMAPGNGKQ